MGRRTTVKEKDKECSITHNPLIIFLDQFSKPEQAFISSDEITCTDIVWNEFGQLASMQQSRE